jgi:hypothetical protein
MKKTIFALLLGKSAPGSSRTKKISSLKGCDDREMAELGQTVETYGTWWNFKPNSRLKAYLEKCNIVLNKHFTPAELLDSFACMVVPISTVKTKNSDILILIQNIQQKYSNKRKCYWKEKLFQQLCEDHIRISERSIDIRCMYVAAMTMRLGIE